ncbi:MAG TPA: lysophospholipid acyltransferase family protein [Ignavibacteriales bacterium]|nr:lysophospholipid acyltransferase family protein [Ignavibacteriales bacterium]HOL81116.1 lysophospholipid acyltransferase family protein [Ignavibacteriales bacterium]HOM65220.1 lysophospholipid acyltransferase family protein [Ignavibacteriales bacterium]HPD66512.1 lysophospholipid acyltransferase family protein [Ignavibacteriales bacterium]HPP33528.1 lysophospholipid acyltransferase family protein [Ignavibacteriales bacterium]
MQIDIKNLIGKYTNTKYPIWFISFIALLLDKILRIKEINSFLAKNSDKYNIDFIDEVFDYLNFSFTILNSDFARIPSEGRLIVVANHPLGGMDGLAILKLINSVRKDVKIVANSTLSVIENIKDLIIPFTLDSKIPQKESIQMIANALQNEECVIFFPAGEVSRLKYWTIKDKKWNKGPVYFAKKYNVPILPIHIKGKNSILFYLIGIFSKFLSMLMLPRELFYQKNKLIHFTVGNYIPAKNLGNFDNSLTSNLLRKHVYKIAKNKKGIFKTENNIIHPIDKKILLEEIKKCETLYQTDDGKKVIITDFLTTPNLITEIARLREITFRLVGEGTGNKKDTDKYDKYYKHIILWDNNELEIIGSYRIGIGKDIYEKYSIDGFYTSTLFSYSNEFLEFLPYSVELGRSFIQKKYWNSFALEYLWRGMGCYFAKSQDIRYLFGVVSISNMYPDDAKKLLVYYYKKWYGKELGVNSNNPFILSEKDNHYLSVIFNSEDIKNDYLTLKQTLKNYGVSIPTLYKNYVELCYKEGVHFLNFGIDEDFGNCIDGFIMLDLHYITEDKKKRYFTLAQETEVS